MPYDTPLSAVFSIHTCDGALTTVEPVLWSPGLSGHLCITAMVMRSQIFSHTMTVCIVVCIKRSPV